MDVTIRYLWDHRGTATAYVTFNSQRTVVRTSKYASASSERSLCWAYCACTAVLNESKPLRRISMSVQARSKHASPICQSQSITHARFGRVDQHIPGMIVAMQNRRPITWYCLFALLQPLHHLRQRPLGGVLTIAAQLVKLVLDKHIRLRQSELRRISFNTVVEMLSTPDRRPDVVRLLKQRAPRRALAPASSPGPPPTPPRRSPRRAGRGRLLQNSGVQNANRQSHVLNIVSVAPNKHAARVHCP